MQTQEAGRVNKNQAKKFIYIYIYFYLYVHWVIGYREKTKNTHYQIKQELTGKTLKLDTKEL